MKYKREVSFFAVTLLVFLTIVSAPAPAPQLQNKVNKLIETVRPSFENNDSQGPLSPFKGYFDQIKNVLERVSRVSSQLSRDQAQLPSRATYRAVHSASAENGFYFDFANAADAQDAYAYFLYHKQRGQ